MIRRGVPAPRPARGVGAPHQQHTSEGPNGEQHLAIYGKAVCGVVSVLCTRDRRVFLMHDAAAIREAVDWERNEVLLQMLSWRDSIPAVTELRTTRATRRGP